MSDSNYTLRWNRSAREAYGHDIEFDRTDPDRIVGWAFALGAAFLLGVILGGGL